MKMLLRLVFLIILCLGLSYAGFHYYVVTNKLAYLYMTAVNILTIVNLLYIYTYVLKQLKINYDVYSKLKPIYFKYAFLIVIIVNIVLFFAIYKL